MEMTHPCHVRGVCLSLRWIAGYDVSAAGHDVGDVADRPVGARRR
ncbi:hypothetical protein AAHZ94_17055 [Streptomyces sp. HSW2009]